MSTESGIDQLIKSLAAGQTRLAEAIERAASANQPSRLSRVINWIVSGIALLVSVVSLLIAWPTARATWLAVDVANAQLAPRVVLRPKDILVDRERPMVTAPFEIANVGSVDVSVTGDMTVGVYGDAGYRDEWKDPIASAVAVPQDVFTITLLTPPKSATALLGGGTMVVCIHLRYSSAGRDRPGALRRGYQLDGTHLKGPAGTFAWTILPQCPEGW